MAQIRLDHIVVAAASLAEGRDWAETRLGVPAAGGGRHAAMGTHNALWGLGKSYLEVIAVDPAGVRPERARWFGFDDAAVQARLAQGPCLLTWAISTGDLAALRAPVPCHPPEGFARDDLRWQVVLPEGAALPLDGAWPLTMRWTHGLHPARRLADEGLRLERLEIAGAGAAEAQAALGPVEGPVVFSPGDGPVRLSATIRTPGGVVTL
jgi:hypothetical protein